MKKISFYFLLAISLSSCMTDNVDGIIIGDTLYAHQDYKENRKMIGLINETLNKNVEAFIKLKKFPNGGAASGYDLGYVITQIIYRLGEDEIIKMVEKFPNNEKNFEGYIDVGLEYGDNDYDGKMDNKKFNNEFPKLFKYLNEKQ